MLLYNFEEKEGIEGELIDDKKDEASVYQESQTY